MNLVLLCALGAVIVAISSALEHVSRQVFVIVFLLLTLTLIRRGSRLRHRGLERLGRAITAWAGVTGTLVAVSGALSLELTQFIPELIAVSAGWLLVLGVWKDLPLLVTGAVVLVGPIVWGSFVWDRSLVAGVLIVVAAWAYARSGVIYRALFGALILSGVLVISAAAHQLTHAGGVRALDGADLLTLMIVLLSLVAAGELESWQEDWSAYAAVVRTITGASAVVLAAVAARPGWVESWTAGTPTSAVARVAVAGIIVIVVVWSVVMSRPATPGGRLKIATWTLAIVALLGTLVHAYDGRAVRWLAVAVLAIWGLRAIYNGLHRPQAWAVVGGFVVIFVAALPVVAPRQGLVPFALLLVAVAGAGTALLMVSRPAQSSAPVGVVGQGAGN